VAEQFGSFDLTRIARGWELLDQTISFAPPSLRGSGLTSGWSSIRRGSR